VHTDFLDLQGRPILRLPYVSGRPDWHLAPVPIEVFGEGESDGAIVGVLDGFGALYRAWTASIVPAGSVVVVEARQVGELIGAGPRDFLLVHTVHNAHTSPPYAWDSEMDLLWSNWFATVDQYDAVIWLTEAQRDDAARRFGEHDNWVVIPHPAAALAALPPVEKRDPNRIVMVSRLADQKRVDHAISAWPAVLQTHPAARLEVYGGGVLLSQLQQLIVLLGLENSVTLHGHVAGASAQLETAAALLLTSRYEGHPLVVAEAFSRGCPVIAYDLNYGPREMVEHGVNGYLVPTGSVEGISRAVSAVLGDPAAIASLSRGAWEWARSHGPELAMRRTADLLETLGVGSAD
jgi:glycosyltransferase involved in cell wall biosynthesis